MKKPELKLELKEDVFSVDEFPDNQSYLKEDVQELVAKCRKRGYLIDLLTAYNAWSAYSSRYDAGWMNRSIEEDKDEVDCIIEYCDIWQKIN